MRRSVLLGVLFLFTACSTSVFPFLKLDKQERAAAAETKNFYIIEEDAPEPRDIRSAREQINSVTQKEVPQAAGTLMTYTPAERIETALVRDLGIPKDSRKYYSFKKRQKPADLLTWMRENGRKDGVILDASIAHWGIDPHPKSKDRYIVSMNVEMQMVDIESGEVMSQYRCYSDTSQKPVEEAPTKYELLKDDKALLKAIYMDRTKDCIEKIRNEALGSYE